MKNPLIPRVNAHLIPGAFYVLLLLAWDSKYRKQTRTRPFRMPGLFGALLCAAGLVAISETAFSQPQKPDPAGIIRLSVRMWITLKIVHRGQIRISMACDLDRFGVMCSHRKRHWIGAQSTRLWSLPPNTASSSVFQLPLESQLPSGSTTTERPSTIYKMARSAPCQSRGMMNL